jgi:hypothetical protein
MFAIGAKEAGRREEVKIMGFSVATNGTMTQ